MMEITEEIRAWIDRNAGATELAADEYIDPTDGLIHCKSCKGQRQTVVPSFGKPGYFMPRCVCPCQAEAERKRQEEEAEKRGETVKPAEKVAEPQPVYKVRTTKNVSIKTVAKTASWRLESKDDVDKYLAALRENLLKEMDEDTIVNIEL